MKKLFATLLFILLLLNFAGVFLYFPVEFYRIHQEMKARLKGLPDEKLEVLFLDLQEYQKAFVANGEIQLNNRMYDVARVKMQGERVTIFAIADKGEDDLLAFLDEVVKKPLQNGKSLPQQIIQFITLTFLVPPQPIFDSSVSECVDANAFYSMAYFSFSPSIESPPPRS